MMKRKEIESESKKVVRGAYKLDKEKEGKQFFLHLL